VSSSTRLPAYGSDTFIFADARSGRYPAEWVPPELSGPTLDAVTIAAPSSAMSSPFHVLDVLVMLRMVLGKRPREAEDTHDDAGLGDNDSNQLHPHKKAKREMTMSGVLEVAGATCKAHHKLATRTPTPKDNKSKAAGRRAGSLAATTVQEVYRPTLPGPRVQQVSVEATAPGQLIWVAGGVDARSWQHHSSGVQEDAEAHSAESEEHEEQTEGELFRIPGRLKERQQALLAAMQADWQRKAVDVLKCRLCPSADFSDWEDFKRHCGRAEAHPTKISFCAHRGDFFARGDALKWHFDKPPGECIGVTADIADLKRRKTDRVHKEFEARL
jgi:hypothetical protein